MREKIIYVADDGKEFEDKPECEAYEFRQKANKLGKHLRLWDEDFNRLCTISEGALEDAYYIYVGTPEARDFVNEHLQGLFDEVGWSATFVGYIDDNWCDLENLYNTVSKAIANMED